MDSPSPGGSALHIGEDHDTSPSKLSKEELIQSMDRVDREIAKVEQQIFKLKKKQVHYLTINLLRNTSLVEKTSPKIRNLNLIRWTTIISVFVLHHLICVNTDKLTDNKSACFPYFSPCLGCGLASKCYVLLLPLSNNLRKKQQNQWSQRSQWPLPQ